MMDFSHIFPFLYTEYPYLFISCIFQNIPKQVKNLSFQSKL